MPLLLGPLKLSFLFFSMCNFIGSIVWTVFFTLLGFYFGAAADLFIKNMKHYEGYLALIIIVIGVLYLLLRWYCKRLR